MPKLTGNMLKIIAAITMVLDHTAVMFFPRAQLLRLIGRLAFPIFAFMIAEGCRYTRNRVKYFLQIFTLAVVCQLVYYIFSGSMYLSVLFTFSLSILTIYALNALKENPTPARWLMLGAVVAGVFWLNEVYEIDYGFWGCMAGVFAALPANTQFDQLENRVSCFAVGLLILATATNTLQYGALLAVPLLQLYNGQRGKRKMKYFFYIFYPVHLAVLQGLAMLLD